MQNPTLSLLNCTVHLVHLHLLIGVYEMFQNRDQDGAKMLILGNLMIYFKRSKLLQFSYTLLALKGAVKIVFIK